MIDISLESIIVASGYLGVFGLMVANGFISFPSSQLLYIISGFFVFTGDLNLWLTAGVGAVGNTVGNIILYEIVRSKGREYITTYKMFPPEMVRKVEIAFERRGAWFLFVGKLLPAIKVFVPIPAGIGKMHRGLFTGIIFVSSYIWSLIFLSIGFYFGKSANVLGPYAVILVVVAFVVVYGFLKYVEKIPASDIVDTN